MEMLLSVSISFGARPNLSFGRQCIMFSEMLKNVNVCNSFEIISSTWGIAIGELHGKELEVRLSVQPAASRPMTAEKHATTKSPRTKANGVQ